MNDQLLQASENRFRKVIEANADGIVIVDKQGIIRFANPAAVTLFARSQASLTGAMFGYPVVANETTEIDVINPYKANKVAEMRVVDIVWQNETAHLASLRDITERKQAEDALRAREHFLTWLNEITRAALQTPDFHTMLQIFADRLGELFGADGCSITLWDEDRQTAVPGAVSSSLAEEFPQTGPDTRQKTITAAVLTSGQPLILEHVGKSPYARMHTAILFPSQSMLALPLIAGAQKLGAAFVIFLVPHHFTPDEIAQGEQVVSHLSLALAKAQSLKAEKEQRELAETLSKVIGVLNSSLAHQQVLDIILAQLAHVVAYDEASVLLLMDGRLHNVSHHASRSRELVFTTSPVTDIPPHMQEVLTQRAPVIRPETAVFPHQPYCWLGVPLSVKEKAIGLLSLIKAEPDFYNRRDAAIAMAFVHQAAIAIVNAQLYEQTQRYADELESRVTQRTQELRQAYHQLQELDRLKSKFIDDISHELRTPLANLMLYLDLLKRGPAAKHPHYITILNQQTERLKELIENILRLSNLDLDQESPVWTQINLNEVAAHVVKHYQNQAELKGLHLTFTPEIAHLPIRGNFKQLTEMLSTLMENALKYTRHGEIRLKASANLETKSAYLYIEDTGMGIAPEDIPHLFDRFYRGQGVSQSNVPGIGLGLTIAKSIATLHNGLIEIDSQPDHGTRVRVNLPLLPTYTT